jgi:hypothetical protein
METSSKPTKVIPKLPPEADPASRWARPGDD